MAKKVARWIAEGTNTLFTSEEAVHFVQTRNIIALAITGIEERKGSLVHELCEGELGDLVHTYRAQKENFEAKEFKVEPGSTGAIKVIRFKAQDGRLFETKDEADTYEQQVMPHVRKLKKQVGVILREGFAPPTADELVVELLEGPLGDTMCHIADARRVMREHRAALDEAAGTTIVQDGDVTVVKADKGTEGSEE